MIIPDPISIPYDTGETFFGDPIAAMQRVLERDLYLPRYGSPWRWEDQLWQTRVRYRGTYSLATGRVTLDP